ncbi:MAG: PIN domain-containing protein [Chloroflexi bacterium]|nr:PIN domain-containing protein [Chloroflexota bacterium]
MTIVVDASAVVAALVDGGPAGTWAEELLRSEPLVAPHILPAEVASVLRRAELAGEITGDTAALAYADLADLTIEFVPYAPVANQVWEFRRNVTPYDGWYVALAEALGVPMATLDARLSASPGMRCPFLVPPAD